MFRFEDTVARTVISTFSILPPKSKPKHRLESTEWVPLSGIVLETSGGEFMCAALGWGSLLYFWDKMEKVDEVFARGKKYRDEMPTALQVNSQCRYGTA